MKSIIRRLSALLLAAVLTASLFSGCSAKEKRINFMYPFTADVNSYDPQVAATSDEFLISEHTVEGLIRMQDDGTVVKGCADSWDISADGLTYTFRLKQGLKWNITTDQYTEGDHKGEYKDKRLQLLGYEFNPDITAHDFVFALQRAVSPETQCPMFPSVAAIENAVAINNGTASPDTLGAEATDDYTLVIHLAAPDEGFLQTLTTAVAMPCNEEFFLATKGRYGLELKYTLFNGQFYVSQILDASYLLKRNEEYKGEFPTVINQLSLRISANDEETGSKSVAGRLESGSYDAAFITGQQTEQLGHDSGIAYVPYEDTTWALLLNTGNEVFQNDDLRYAFCVGLTKTDVADKDYLQAADNLLPRSCTVGGQPAAEAIGRTTYTPNEEKSITYWKSGLKALGVSDVTVTVLTVPEMEMPLKEMLQGVQAGIGSVIKDDDGNALHFTLKVETASLSELSSAVAKREYDAVLYPFRSSSTSPVTYLKDFCTNNKTGFDATAAEAALTEAEGAQDTAAQTDALRRAEQAIVDSFSVYPMLRETSYYASAKGVTGIQFHAGSGRVSFVAATRED